MTLRSISANPLRSLLAGRGYSLVERAQPFAACSDRDCQEGNHMRPTQTEITNIGTRGFGVCKRPAIVFAQTPAAFPRNAMYKIQRDQLRELDRKDRNKEKTQ